MKCAILVLVVGILIPAINAVGHGMKAATEWCTKPPPPDYGEHERRVDEKKTMTLECRTGWQIRVWDAVYGQEDSSRGWYCGRKSSDKGLSKSKQLCDGKNSCRIKAHNDVFGDPCRGTKKQLWVKFRCFSGKNGCIGRNAEGCCAATDTRKCGLGQGNCESDDDCANELVCGTDNCVRDWGGKLRWYAGTNRCCKEPVFVPHCTPLWK